MQVMVLAFTGICFDSVKMYYMENYEETEIQGFKDNNYAKRCQCQSGYTGCYGNIYD